MHIPLTTQIIGRGILLFLTMLLVALLWYGFDKHSTIAQGTYVMENTLSTCVDTWDDASWGNCNFPCNAANAGRGCMQMINMGGYQTCADGSVGNFEYNEWNCVYYPPACVPSSACAANTCSDTTCSDSCGNSYAGTKSCAPPPPVCNVTSCDSSPNACGVTSSGTRTTCDNGYDSGCSASVPAVVDQCPADPGTQCSLGECSSCVANAGNACNANMCGVAGGTITCDGSCSGSTPAPIDQCPSDPGIQCDVSSCTGGGDDGGGDDGGGDGGGGGGGDDGGGGGGGGGGACPGTDAATISATPNRVIAGANTSVTLTWSGSDLDATTCTVTNLTTGAPVKAATAVASCSMSDSSAVASVNAQTTFRLACGSLTRDVTVNVLPKFEEF